MTSRLSNLSRLLLAVGLCACGEKSVPKPKLATTYRALTGISMGGVGAAALGLQQPEKFDAIASLGGPLDAALFLRMLDRFHLGGFCTRAEIEAILAQGPEKLNDPKSFAACSKRAATVPYERSQDFNHLTYTHNGHFDRDAYLDLFTDLTLAYGNTLYENPASPFVPPGVPVEWGRIPEADFCKSPIRVKGLKNLEYNPEGKYDAITFCDGEPKPFFCKGTHKPVDFCSDPKNLSQPLSPSQEEAFAAAYCADKGGFSLAMEGPHTLYLLNHNGRTDTCRVPGRALRTALAIDFNGNGFRDYGEPVVSNGQERFDDVGTDGCPNEREDGSGGCHEAVDSNAGDRNGDDFVVGTHPLGTEGDWRWTEGEPYRDDGLDGVPGSGDLGEGNGQFDLASARKAIFANDPRTMARALDVPALKRLNFLFDGGLRDPFNFGLGAKLVYDTVSGIRPEDSASYREFVEIPGMADERTGAYKPWGARWERLPRNIFLLYGKESPSDRDRIDGDGDHVGSGLQSVNRLYTLFNWAASQWPSLERPSTPLGGMSYDSREIISWYDSKLLGAKREFAVVLPPGYELAENQEKRYPVMVVLHGYTQTPRVIVTSAFLADTYMKDTSVRLRPMIMVFPSGACCFVDKTTGARDCREADDSGRFFTEQPNFERECVDGNFFANRRGYTNDDARPYGDSVFELLDEVDQRYRTMPPAELDAR